MTQPHVQGVVAETKKNLLYYNNNVTGTENMPLKGKKEKVVAGKPNTMDFHSSK